MSSGEKRAEGLEALERDLRRLGVELGLYNQAAAERLGLGATDLDVLTLLQEGGASTAGQLAAATFLTTGAVTGVIDRLERAGYVRRGSDPQDRRRVMVELVAERGERLQRAFEPIQRAAGELAAAYTKKEIELVADFVRRAAQALHERTGQLHAAAAPEERAAESGDFSAPLAGVKRARLELASGAANLALVVAPETAELFHAHFEGRVPRVHTEGGVVTVGYPRFKLFDWRRSAGRIGLSPDVPWDIEVRGGLSKLDADLGGLHLRSLEITHGASGVAIVLPRPKGTVCVRVTGGASSVTLKRPREIPVRLHMTGGASAISFDSQKLRAVGGELNLESNDYGKASDRYEVEITGGASSIAVAAL